MQRNRVKHHLEPAIIGISCVLGAPGLPTLTRIIGQVALDQGRAEDRESNMRSLEPRNDESPIPSPSLQGNVGTEDEDAEDAEDDKDENERTGEEAQATEDGGPNSNGDEPQKKRLIFKAHSQSQPMREAAQTTPVFSTITDGIRRSVAIDDPFGQLDVSSTSVLPYRSSPAIPASKKTRQSESGNVVETLIQEYDPDTQRRLLQAHYCRSEVRIVLFEV